MLILLLGLTVRTPRLGYPLWRDEAWVANAVLSQTADGFFFYPAWLPLNPPLFLLAARLFPFLFGANDVTLHLGPLLLGMVALVCVAVLAVKLLDPVWAVVATAIVALSPTFVLMSQQLKHYAADCCASAILLLALYFYGRAPRWATLVGLTAAACVAAGLSFASALLMPAAVILVAIPRIFDSRHRASAILHSLVFAGVMLAVETSLYLLFIGGRSDPSLSRYWAAGLAGLDSASGAAQFLLRRLPFLLIHLPLPQQLHTAWLGAAMALVLAGTWASLRALSEYRPAALLIVLSFWITLIAAGAMALLHQYPLPGRFGEGRLTLYFLPLLALMVAWSLQALSRRLIGLVKFRVRPWAVRVLTWAAALGLVIFSVILARKVADRDYWGFEDTRGAISQIRSNIAGGEVLYVHAFLAQPAKLYFRLQGWNNPPAVFGDTGYACCPKGKDLSRTNGNPQHLKEDLDRLFPSPPARRLWMLIPVESYGPGKKPLYDETARLLEELSLRGFTSEKTMSFQHVSVVTLVPAPARR